MPTDDEPPSALWCLAAALLPALLFCCFLHPSALLWWFPVWVAIFYLPMPAMLQDGPKNFMLCTLAVYWTAHAEGWSTSRVLLGTTAWSKCSVGRAPARLMCLLKARLAVLGSLALPGRGRPTGRPVVGSGWAPISPPLTIQAQFVRGQRVLELGSGIGIAGLSAALAGATHVTLTDVAEDERWPGLVQP